LLYPQAMHRLALAALLSVTAFASQPAHAGSRKAARGKRIDARRLGAGWGKRKALDVAEGRRLGKILFEVAARPARRKDGSIDVAVLGKPFHTRPHLDVRNASASVYTSAELGQRLDQLGLSRELLDHPAMTPQHNPVFTPGRRFDNVWFRYSAAPGDRGSKDGKGGFHGVAIRMFGGDAQAAGGIHDLLLTNANPAHISNEQQQVAFAEGLSRIVEGVKTARGGVRAIPKGAGTIAAGARTLVRGLGPVGTLRTFTTLAKQGRRPIDSIFTETYHGRTPNQFGVNAEGEPVAVKYRLVPLGRRVAVDGDGQPFAGSDRLKREGAAQLAGGDVEVELQLQYFVGESTPIDDARVEWKNSPFIPFMKFRIPAQDVRAAEARGEWADLEDAGFNPGHVLAEGYLPVGPGALRPVVYDEVQRLRRETERTEAARAPATTAP
jgi:hypothetical protein